MNKLLQFIFLGLLLFTFNYSYSQEWNWAKNINQAEEAFVGKGMAKLSNHEIAIIGYTPNPAYYIETGTNPRISIIDKDGNEKNAINFGGKEEIYLEAIATDQNDNIYVIGEFSSVIYIIGKDTLLNQGNTDGFIVKFDKELNILWTKTIATKDYEEINDINVDSKGNVYVIGKTTKYNPNNSYKVYFIKYSSEGNIIWERRGTTKYGTFTKSILIDKEDNCYWVGFADSLYFNDGNSIISTQESYLNYVIKISSDNQWINSITLPDIQGAYLDDQYLYIVQSLDDIYARGISTTKYNLDFGLIWKKYLKGFETMTNMQEGSEFKIAVDEEKNVYLTGSLVNENFVFASETFISSDTTYWFSDLSNIYLFKYNKDGKERWAKKIGDTEKFYNFPEEILAYGNDELVILGNFQSDTLDIGNYILYNNNQKDTLGFTHGSYVVFKNSMAFIASIKNIKTGINQNYTLQTKLYPNPVHDIFTLVLPESNFKKGTVEIYNINGSLIKFKTIHSGENKHQINLKDLPIGTYLIHTQIDDKYSIQKIIKQ